VADSLPKTDKQSPELQEILNKVRKRFDSMDKARKPYVTRWREWYGLHRNYRRFARANASAGSEADRDEIRREGQREFGAELFIPYAFTVVETTVPRVLMNDPRMKVKPKSGKLTPDRADAVKEMFEERQSEIDYALTIQPIARRGLKYGLGVGKTYWDQEGRQRPIPDAERMRKMVKARLLGGPEPGEFEFVIDSEGPTIEDVELEDFFWDWNAKSMKTCRDAIHRTWRDWEYCREKLDSGEWDAAGIELDALKGVGGTDTDRYTMLSERASAAGLDGVDTKGSEAIYEIWEYHDGNLVHTVLGRKYVVKTRPNPFNHRKLPFQIYRPTLQEGEFVGIGEIEPIVHLQYELNTLRSQRRDNATMVLQKAFAYAEGMLDPSDLVIGPGKGIPVYGDPRQVIQAIDIGEIPASGYQEEAALKADIELASGTSDTVAGGSGAANASAETATGIQLVQAAANVRVEMKTKQLHAETIKPAAAQWLELYRQNTTEKPRVVTVDGPQGYSFKEVSPEDLAEVRAVLPEEDSTAPENTPQKRNDALALYNQTRGNEIMDPRKAGLYLLRAFDVPDAQEWIMPEQTQMNPQVAQVVGETLQRVLKESGMKEEDANQIAIAAMQEAMQAAGVSEPPQAAEESANGAAPPSLPQEA
jgi:hypothetical protein